MKKILIIMIMAVCFGVSLFFIGCTSDDFVKSDKFTVILQEGKGFEIIGEYVYRVDKGGTAEFEIKLSDGFEINSVGGGEFCYEGDNIKIVCKDIHSHITVIVKTVLRDSPYSVMYDLNGGSSAKNETQKYILESYDPQIRLRVNTLTYESVAPRNGYSLVGWNTDSGGNGEHIGLGSRVTLSADSCVGLYAEWKEWTAEDKFTVTESDAGECAVVRYVGNDKEIVIPEFINGAKVTAIRNGAFSNIKSADTVVLPSTLRSLDAGAFTNCTFSELYLYDTIEEIGDDSFDNCNAFASLFVNAATPPRYSGAWTSAWADKCDRIILSPHEEKQMVFFAGSSMAFGLISGMVDESFGGEYKITNLGLSYMVDMKLQQDFLYAVLDDNDILVHAPEDISDVEENPEFERITWRVLESNYDMLKYTDIREHRGIFNVFEDYNNVRKDAKITDYNDKSEDYDTYGDIAFERENTDDTDKGYETWYNANTLSENVLTGYSDYYAKLQSKGTKVYFSYGPANLDGKFMPPKGLRLAYAEKVSTYIVSVPIISDMENYLYNGKYFWDTNYHLSTEGAEMRTEQLIKDIKLQMTREGNNA